MEKGRRQRKSRRGCRNCKLRKVKVCEVYAVLSFLFPCGYGWELVRSKTPLIAEKCDEARPRCGKCEGYGVVCNYQKAVPDLQVASEEGSQWRVEMLGRASHGNRGISPTRSSGTSLSIPLSTFLVSADEESSIDLDAWSVGLLSRYQRDTASTLGGPAMQKICDSDLLQLAFLVRLPPGGLPQKRY
ncbi:Zn(II)2Cys6 transcription factor [Candidatus Bathyarchaeota archaeon]|nr:Zn(II)2Cys6 transcription factor [Candidatus Bathyarchaeota archaeon]